MTDVAVTPAQAELLTLLRQLEHSPSERRFGPRYRSALAQPFYTFDPETNDWVNRTKSLRGLATRGLVPVWLQDEARRAGYPVSELTPEEFASRCVERFTVGDQRVQCEARITPGGHRMHFAHVKIGKRVINLRWKIVRSEAISG